MEVQADVGIIVVLQQHSPDGLAIHSGSLGWLPRDIIHVSFERFVSCLVVGRLCCAVLLKSKVHGVSGCNMRSRSNCRTPLYIFGCSRSGRSASLRQPPRIVMSAKSESI